MKRAIRGSTMLLAVLMLSLPAGVWALHSATHGNTKVAAEDIQSTIHNLSSSSILQNKNIVSAETEVCIFCHTPHGGVNKAGTATDPVTGFPPLWNRINPSTAYSLYDSPHFEKAESAGPKGVSLACLSCHDGTVALDMGINLSGSGGFNPSGARTFRVTPSAGDMLDADGSFKEGPPQRTDTGPNFEVITGSAEPFPSLGVDLRDDHPFSMRIPNDNGPCKKGNAVEADPQFDNVCIGAVQTPSGLTYLQRITPPGGLNSALPADKRDRIRGYPTDNSGAPFIECASCHNPHAPRPLLLRLPSFGNPGPLPSGGGTVTVSDVLGAAGITTLIANDPNAGSLVCITCHEK